jgi:quercetin dioxygenase-like cupin family protein
MRRSAVRSVLVPLSLALSASIAAAQGTPTAEPAHAVMILPDQENWSPAPPSLPAGAKVAVLDGDPKQKGAFTMRISLPDGYRIPPHFHPAVERVTVIEGNFQLGMGDKFDETALKSMKTGAFIAMQPGTRHFAKAKGNTVVQVNAMGPWKLTYVNPADDPRNEKPTP